MDRLVFALALPIVEVLTLLVIGLGIANIILIPYVLITRSSKRIKPMRWILAFFISLLSWMLLFLLLTPSFGSFTLYDFYTCAPSQDPLADTLANSQEMRELSKTFLILAILNASLVAFSIYRLVSRKRSKKETKSL